MPNNPTGTADIPTAAPDPSWRVLIVDDDEDVHEVTVLALKRVEILGRKLEFHHAASAAEAIEVLRNVDDITLILLDAVMETEDAGLSAVKVIREELGMEDVRIILRTGQPGHIPELDTITRYDINDYRTKDELTRERLLTVVTAAMRSWQQIRRIQNSRRGLEKIVEASNQFIMAKGLKTFAEGVISQMASLFGLEPEGLVCASADDPGADESRGCCRVIAAAGEFRHLIDCNVDEIEDRRIRDSIDRAIRDKQNVQDENGLTIFFREPAGRQYATWIGSGMPIRSVDNHLIEIFCTNISLCAANINLVSRLENLAWQDQLLHIPNLAALLERLKSILEAGDAPNRILAVFDIDDFGAINDLLGHQYGDGILKAVSERLGDIFLPDGEVYRIGSDVFGVIAEREAYESRAGELSEPLSVSTGDGVREISLSTGITSLDSVEGEASTQLRNAYIALKRAKDEGIGQSVYYSREIGTRTRERLSLLHHLQAALSGQHLHIAYQPQASLSDGRITGMEALVRWKDSHGRDIPPGDFIPLAEKSGLIRPLGYWILNESLKALSEIHQSGFPELTMAVNISPNQLRQKDFPENLDEALRNSRVAPESLELEITESISMFGVDDVIRMLEGIRGRGISLAVDDFGTGYSSLSSIDRWPVNRLKIDRSFISQLDEGGHHGRLVDLVVPLGEKLSMRVLAEGVETETQWNRLRDMGCHDVQGFFLGRPMSLDKLKNWLNERRRDSRKGAYHE